MAPPPATGRRRRQAADEATRPPAVERRPGHFRPQLFAFLRDLREHNDRAWFADHRDRYEAGVREPLRQFVVDFAPHLAAISEHFVADPRPVGGSLFRIHRDTRFSPDKRPFKTNAGAQFRHAAGRDAHAPAFYLHLEPGEVFAAAGLWRPDATARAQVRDAIVARPADWQRLVASATGPSGLHLSGASLTRPPRGYDPAHPLIDDLKRTDFVVVADLSEGAACRPDFLDSFVHTCRSAAPFVRFLTEAIGLPW